MINQFDKLEIFVRGIIVDEHLPKFLSIKEEKKKSKNLERLKEYEESDGELDVPVSLINNLKNENWELSKNIDYDYLKDADTKQLNIYVSSSLFKDILSPYAKYNSIELVDNRLPNDQSKIRFFSNLYDKIKSKFAKDIIELDVFEFFRQVKGITEENVNTYKNRLNGYIIALKNADLSGQEALKEKLLNNFVINKYESVLFANGLYNVVTEEQIVNFYKKSEKGINLCYIKNYVNIIPAEICKKIEETNKLEIFDNYVILHYDPTKKSYQQTIQERKEDVQKRRDPILFGVIKGSNKLYYITDWVDDYCDLTLDKFAEVIQEDKNSFRMKEEIMLK